LPMGVQIIGKNHVDFAVLQIAYAYEQATHWVQKALAAAVEDKTTSFAFAYGHVIFSVTH